MKSNRGPELLLQKRANIRIKYFTQIKLKKKKKLKQSFPKALYMYCVKCEVKTRDFIRKNRVAEDNIFLECLLNIIKFINEMRNNNYRLVLYM
jgi:hypothetical protein